jgi:sulfur carrier protein
MRFVINGKDKDLPDFTTVAELAEGLGLPAFGCAIELNGEVVRKAEWKTRRLLAEDRLEIVRLVGGG